MASGFKTLIGWLGWLSSGPAADELVISERFDLVGIDNQKFSLVGTENAKFDLVGTDNQKFTLTGG